MKKLVKQIFMMILAGLLYALATNVLLKPGNILPGGISGVTLLIQKICDIFFSITIPYSLVNLLLNIFPIYIGFKYIGKKFTLLTLIMILSSSFFIDLIPVFNTFTDEVLLYSVFGGIAIGFVISICLNMGATSGGTDFISIYLIEKKNINAWLYILIFNCCILLIAGLLFDFEIALFSIIAQYSTYQMIRLFHKDYDKSTMMIFTRRASLVYDVIRKYTKHDATLIKGCGMYSGNEVDIIYSVVNYNETELLSKEIKKADKDAFINIIKDSEVNGKFYIKPKE